MTPGAGRTCCRISALTSAAFVARNRRHESHGKGGEWRVSRQRLRWDILDAFADAAAQAGFARVDDFNTGDNAGVSYFDVNQRGGFRVSSAKAFLKPARATRESHRVDPRAHRGVAAVARDAQGALRCTGARVLPARRARVGPRGA